MKQKIKCEKGITLIALVITIIILLILASVTLSLLLDDNGILNRAKTSSLETYHATVKEQVILKIDDYTMANSTGEYGDNVLAFLKKENYISDVGQEDYDRVQVELKVKGIKTGKGKTKEEGDIYVIEENTEQTAETKVYRLRYYDKNGNSKDLLSFNDKGKEINSQDENVDEQVAGLYDENNHLITTWEQLVQTYHIDIEKDYNVSNYETETTSLPYILSHTETTATKLIVGEGVTKIGNYALYRCQNLSNIVLPNTIQTIGSFSFSYCSALTTIAIPNSVTDMSENAFAGCGQLTDIIISNNITSLKNTVFAGCSKLSTISIPDSVTSIGNQSFASCTSLQNIELPKNLESISQYAFAGCTGLTSISIPGSVTEMGEQMFAGCTNLKEVTILPGVSTIGKGAFKQNTSITTISIPNSVTTIGEEAFYGCQSLTTITIPDYGPALYIKPRAFSGCIKLNLVIPDRVIDIGENAFLAVPHIEYHGIATGSPWGAYSCN